MFCNIILMGISDLILPWWNDDMTENRRSSLDLVDADCTLLNTD